jgi:hypothetical protein
LGIYLNGFFLKPFKNINGHPMPRTNVTVQMSNHLSRAISRKTAIGSTFRGVIPKKAASATLQKTAYVFVNVNI